MLADAGAPAVLAVDPVAIMLIHKRASKFRTYTHMYMYV